MYLIDQKTAQQEILKYYERENLIPFIGSGFSKPLGLPIWNELINWISEKLNFDYEIFNLQGTPQQLAEYLYLSKPKLYKQFIHKMSTEFDSSDANKLRQESITHQALSSLNINTVYTTNYDHHIEECFKDNNKTTNIISSLDDFINPELNADCDVVKFHGTLSDPKTIILRESDYFKRMSLEAPIDQKLRADILGNVFLFIGYSFQDPNIRYIWYKIKTLIENEAEHEAALESYFISFGPGNIQPILLKSWNIKVIQLDPSDKNKSLSEFLTNIKK